METETEVLVKRPTFWGLADDLEAYGETLSMIEAELENEQPPEEIQRLMFDKHEVEQAIERIGEELVSKTDNLVGVINRLKVDGEVLKAEEKRLHAKRKAQEAALEWLKDYTIKTMQAHNWKNLKTQLNTVLLKGNGGLQPLKTEMTLLPDSHTMVMIKVTGEDWQDIQIQYPSAKMLEVEANNAKIRESIAAGVEIAGAKLEPRSVHIELK